MDDRELFHRVAKQAGLSVAESADLTRATLETLADRLSNGEARHLAEQLPDSLRQYLPQRRRIERFGLTELVRRVSARIRLSTRDTEAGVRALLTTLSATVADFDHVLSQLPGEFRSDVGRVAR